jgi:hypothetical protein
LFARAEATLKSLGDTCELALARLQRGRLLLELGRPEQASPLLKTAVRSFRRLSVVTEAEEASRLLYGLEVGTDRGSALIQGLFGITALDLAPERFVERALSILCDNLQFEQGAVLVAGPNGAAAMRVPPHFDVSKDEAGDISLTIMFVSIGGDFSSFSGTENVIIESNLRTRDHNVYEGGEWDLGKNISINLTTPYSGAWASYFNETLTEPLTNLTAGADFNLATSAGWVRLDLNGVKRMDLGVAVVETRIK